MIKALMKRKRNNKYSGGADAARTEIEIIKREINRKLYQKPPLVNE
ncbi:MAG: hypothetical protein NC337_02330 [Roseburia sp.]|nr:hypothetical protein [Roseburia sp.]